MGDVVFKDDAQEPEAGERQIDIWLRQDVVPAYDAYRTDPSRVAPLSDAVNRIRKRQRAPSVKA